jgi:MoxR-like ATPase
MGEWVRGVESPAALAERLDATGYLADTGLATAVFLALRMERPLFLEGEAGTGKTSLAQALATLLEVPLIRLQCYEGIEASQALYDWDFPRRCCTCAPRRLPDGTTPTGWSRSCTTAGS